MFENEQWVVTEFGLEAKGTHSHYTIVDISLGNLLEGGDRAAPTYFWSVHMSHKRWVNRGLFNDAFEHALAYHGHKIDRDALKRSFESKEIA